MDCSKVSKIDVNGINCNNYIEDINDIDDINYINGNKIEIRKMSLKDLDSISEKLYSDFDDFWSYDVLKDELCMQNSLYFVAICTGELVGFAGIKIILDEAEIMNIVVKKSYRKRGIGSYLLGYLIDVAFRRDLKAINLEVSKSNVAAIKMYEKFGFCSVGFRKEYYGDCGAILMTKRKTGTPFLA